VNDDQPIDDLERAIRAEYEQAPAHTPFSHKPIPYEAARKAGINSWARAYRRALVNLHEQSGEAA
jgi:hypothetical protein